MKEEIDSIIERIDNIRTDLCEWGHAFSTLGMDKMYHETSAGFKTLTQVMIDIRKLDKGE